MNLRVERLSARNSADFYAFQCEANGNEWCHCVAWWVPTWDKFSERSEAENRALREELFARGEYDGYLLYLDGQVSGWCQAGARDRLQKLVRQYALAPNAQVWAITCVELAPAARGKGYARQMLERVLDDLKALGITRVQSFPRRGSGHAAGEVWTGPEALYARAGFKVIGGDDKRLVMELAL